MFYNESAKILGVNSPIQVTYPVTPNVSIVTSIFGDNRDAAMISIYNGSIMVWGMTVTQMNPSGMLPYDLIFGNVTINKGATFTLTAPTAIQMGTIMMNAMIITPWHPAAMPFNAQVACWTLEPVAEVSPERAIDNEKSGAEENQSSAKPEAGNVYQ